MNYLCLFTTIICCIFCYKRDKTVFSPSVAFSGLFSIVFIFASSGWYGMYSAPDSAYSLITIGVLSFLIGTVVMKKYSLKNAFYITGKNINENDRLHSRIYWRMFWLCILVLMSSIIMIGTYLMSGATLGDVYVVAAAATDGEVNELSKGGFQVLLESYIAYPLLYLLVPVSLVEFFSSYKKKYLFVALFLALLRVCLDARRTYLTAFILMTVICIYMHRKDYKFFNAQLYKRFKYFRKYSLFIVLFVFFFFSYVSSQRSIAKLGEDESSTIVTLVEYYGGCVQFFGYCIENVVNDHTFGFSTFRGFLAPFWGIFKLIGIESPSFLNDANKYLETLHATVLNINPSKPYNSFATCFFQFYCDFGVVGIVALSFLYGVFAENIFEKMVILKSKRAEATYIFFFANIMMLSFVNMETVLALNFWPLVLVRFLYPSNNKIWLKKESYG